MGRRNFQGGNKTKSMAKSNISDDRDIRVPLTDEEEYAIVTAVSGNGRFKVASSNKLNYTAILPGSMRGSKKRKCYVENNSILLINNRSSWQTVKPNSTVDIIHVYSINHISHLKLTLLFSNITTTHKNDMVHFQNDHIQIEETTKFDESQNNLLNIQNIDILNI